MTVMIGNVGCSPRLIASQEHLPQHALLGRVPFSQCARPIQSLRSTGPQSWPAHAYTTSTRQYRRVEASSFQGEPSTSYGLAPELKAALENFISEHKVVLFMKGNRQFPQCGFSNTCVQILNVMGVPYETVNILEDESLRQGMKEFSQWPTFPQVYINGEFFGGCDIMIEGYQSGELKEILEAASLS